MIGLCTLTVNEYIAYVIFEFSATHVFCLGLFVDFLLYMGNMKVYYSKA